MMPPHPDEAAGGQEEEKPRDESRLDDTRSKRKKGKRWWNMFSRWKDGEESDWWFASTGIP